MIFSDHSACTLSRRALFAAWLLAMLAVPCWSLGQDKPAKDKPAEEQSAEDPSTKVNVTAKVGPQRTIRVHENRVYIADGNEKTITALDRSSGKIVWQTKTDGWNGEAELVFEGDELRLGSRDGLVVYRELLKLDKNTGEYLATEASPDQPLKDPRDDSAGPSKTEQVEHKQVLEAKIKVAEAELKLRRAQEALEHNERMFRKGYLTQLQRDAASLYVKVAERELANAKAPHAPKEAPDVVDKIQLAAQSAQGSSSGLSGLVELAAAYIDALGERDLAERKLEIQARLAADRAVSQVELAETQQRLATAERKVKLFRKIAEAAKSAAEVEVQELKSMYKNGRATRIQLSEAEIRLHVLRAILES